MLTAFFVVVRILANPISNVFQKQLAERSASPIFIIGSVHACLALVCGPLWLFRATPVPYDVWLNMLAAATLAVSGNTLLVYALRSTDLSILGPVNAYKSVVGLILAIFLIGEYPSAAGMLCEASRLPPEDSKRQARGGSYERSWNC